VAARIPLKLLRKRNALAYELQQILERANTIEEELQALDYAITLIEPSWRPPDRASRPGRAHRLPFGKITSETLGAVRDRPGANSLELADIVAARCKVKLPTETDRKDFSKSVTVALRRFERRGLLEIVRKDKRSGVLHWQVRHPAWRPREA
jgi:hypothetical protein